MNTTDNSVEWRLSPTSITVKRGTKRLLDSLGSKRESYDEIIRRLIHEHKRPKSPEVVQRNRLSMSVYNRKSSSQSFDERKIFYEYNVPGKDLRDFRFNIIYTKIIGEKKLSNKLDKYESPSVMTKEYFAIYEKLIRTYIDPLFRIDKRRIMDLDQWKVKLRKLGFSDDTYRSDIEEQLIHMGMLP